MGHGGSGSLTRGINEGQPVCEHVVSPLPAPPKSFQIIDFGNHTTNSDSEVMVSHEHNFYSKL